MRFQAVSAVFASSAPFSEALISWRPKILKSNEFPENAHRTANKSGLPDSDFLYGILVQTLELVGDFRPFSPPVKIITN